MIFVLFQPRIPQNTGNILRTCKALGALLVLVCPLGFSIADRKMRRAGLDYTDKKDFILIDDLEKYLENHSSFYFFSSKASTSYTNVTYKKETLLIFGNETEGLPDYFWEKWPERFVTIPMEKECRCLNLSNACAVAGFEAKRQLQATGK